MKKYDVIKTGDGQTAIIIFGEESNYKHCCIVKLENGQLKVIDKKSIRFTEVSDLPKSQMEAADKYIS